MQPGDRVRIMNGYYQGQEGHIEGIKDGQFVVALQNDFGCVNTVMPAKRLEVIEYGSGVKIAIEGLQREIDEIQKHLNHIVECLQLSNKNS